LADSQDAIELKRRARRRLVGAIALVVLVVIALPIVLDREPKPVSQDLSIQIPSQDAGSFSSRVLPAESPAVPAAEARTVDTQQVEAKPAVPALKAQAPVTKPPVAKPEAAPTTHAAPSKEAAKAATDASAETKPSAVAADGQFIVPLGVFSKADNIKQVRAKAALAGFKTFTESLAGTDRVRVRAGPFANRDAAEQARNRLKEAGLDVGAVSTK